jgi:microcystin-dependent protein
MGPLSGPEIPKISPERLQKSRGFTPAAARLIAACLKSKIGTPSFGIMWQVLGTLDTCVSRFDLLLSVINDLSGSTTNSKRKTRLDALNLLLRDYFAITLGPPKLPLETATFTSDLVPSNPAHTDGLSQADSHMRLLKSTIKATFPNFTAAALASTQAQLDAAVGAVVSGAGTAKFANGTAASPSITFSSDATSGFFFSGAGTFNIALGGTGYVTFASTLTRFFMPLEANTVKSDGAFTGGTGQLVPIGAVLEWYDDVLPPEGGYAWANGQIIASANTVCPVLLARWGTRFGGNGTTTMGVPDRRDTVGIGKSTMGGVASRGLQTLGNTVLGTLIGAANVVLGIANLPPITSSGTFGLSASNIVTANGDVTVFSNGTGGSTLWQAWASALTIIRNTITASGSVTSSGTTSTPVNNVQPSTTCNYILRLG